MERDSTVDAEGTFRGKVVSVNRSLEKGTSKEPVAEIEVDVRGVVGDGHAGETHRQISLLAIESIERFSATTSRTFWYGDFAENITTQGIDLFEVGVLDRFTVGPVELEVTQLGKKCHGGECAIFREVGQCVMPKEGLFCRVVRGGRVRPGDKIVHTPRPLCLRVITMSDRAHQGVYEDQSGPRVRALIETFLESKRWHPQFEMTVLPDDAEGLKMELETARDDAVDVVFITGGTGIGPRDVTPEVVAALADKIIPGLMEHIRLKFGAEKPNALLSRSVAAVMGRTLVYALPGSVRAVEEYMGEIVKTLEHAICMLHGLDIH